MPDRERRRQLVGLLLGGSVAVLVALLAWLLVSVNKIAADGRETQQGNASTLQLIEDCTTKGGGCYEESERRTGNVIAVLNEFTTYVIACADKPGTQDAQAIRVCATDQLRKAQKP